VRKKRAEAQSSFVTLLSRWTGMHDDSRLTPPSHELSALCVTHSLIRLRLAPLVLEVRKHDRDLASQLTRSASSIAANLAEGQGSTGGTQRARYENALGSARETRAHLRTAAAWGYIGDSQGKHAEDELDRVCAMTFRLLHPRRR